MTRFWTAFACATLLLALPSNRTTAQDPKSDIEALKGELAKTKADLEAMKKELAQVKADLEILKVEVLGPPLKLPPKDVQVEFLKRWNAVAGDKTFDVPVVRAANFTWTEFTQFPHPTYKGGSGEAYGALGQVLLTFLQKGDNYEYMAKNGLFTVDLVTSLGNTPKGKGIRSNFAQWARQLSAPNALAKMDDESRKALAEFSKKIDETGQQNDPPKK